jgi:hypothetical protein
MTLREGLSPIGARAATSLLDIVNHVVNGDRRPVPPWVDPDAATIPQCDA